MCDVLEHKKNKDFWRKFLYLSHTIQSVKSPDGQVDWNETKTGYFQVNKALLIQSHE